MTVPQVSGIISRSKFFLERSSVGSVEPEHKPEEAPLMKPFLVAAALAFFVATPVIAADDNGMHPESSKKPNPSVSSKNTNSDGSSVSSGANGTSTGTSGNTDLGSAKKNPPPTPNDDSVKVK